MLKNEGVEVTKPAKCPKCKQEYLPGCDPYGPPMLILIEDPHFAAKWLILKGWICGDLAFGTVIRRGPDASRGETELQDIISHDHNYVLTLKDRTHHIP